MKNHIINEQEKLILDGAIRSALNILYKEDPYLIEHHLHEQCIAFRFGLYLYKELQLCGFSDYNLDAEYDKNMDRKKWLKSWPKGARPDFILHKRGDNMPTNILIIELKKGKRPRVTKKDENKIKEFMKYPYGYCYGATILISPNEYKLKWIPL